MLLSGVHSEHLRSYKVLHVTQHSLRNSGIKTIEGSMRQLYDNWVNTHPEGERQMLYCLHSFHAHNCTFLETVGLVSS